MKTSLSAKDLKSFANELKNVLFKEDYVKVGSFLLKIDRAPSGTLLNFSGKDMFDRKLQFSTVINGQHLTFYIQLYENITGAGNKHFRLASYVESKKGHGMIFTINLSSNRDSEDQLFLTSKFRFTQQPKGHKELATAHNKLKQYLFAEILYNLDFDITDNNDIIFGIYDLGSKKFLTTSPEKFISDFLVVTILKGHFMANKGYEIELFPSFKNINSEHRSYETDNDSNKILPNVVKDQRAKRAISLSLRFKVLHRDKSTCIICGKNPNDGVKMHIDHITPHSKGGLTVYNNLRTLCSECNIGRSNKYTD
jgi:hypothetical protein